MNWSGHQKTAPTLDVIAPTSQLAAARMRTVSRSPSDSRGQETTKSAVSADSDVFRFRGIDSAGASELGGARLSSIPTEDVDGRDQTHWLAGLVRGLPSWMVSLIVHLGLILILAISSLGVGRGYQQLELEFADASAEFSSIQTEIEFEEIVFEDELEQLDPDHTDSDVATDAAIPLENMEALAVQTEPETQAELGIFNGLLDSPAAASGSKRKSATFFGTESYGSKFVFVIDCSKSMKGNRWYHALKELNTAIDGLEASQEFLVLLYNEGTYVMMGIPKSSAALVEATGENKDQCRRWLRKQRPDGGTFPATSMFLALSLDPDAIFLLSDGELQDNTRGLLKSWNGERQLASGAYGRIPIHTVSLGRQGQGKMMMKSIAEQNDGRFTWIQ